MGKLADDISLFLKDRGFGLSHRVVHDFEVISAPDSGPCAGRTILPLEICAADAGEAEMQASAASDCIAKIKKETGIYPIVISEDRWHRQRDMMQARLLAHLEVFTPIYARNCEVRRIDKNVAREFLEAWHSYGFSSCRYCYGLFFKRHTGHNSGLSVRLEDETETISPVPGTLVAVACFSNARRWKKGEKEIRSYEWTRYASLPSLRISGGMGRMLKSFIKDVSPDDIMSYADLEWSEGDVYEKLGFIYEGLKNPVFFRTDKESWTRKAVKPEESSASDGKPINFRNFGSAKFRLKLTGYE